MHTERAHAEVLNKTAGLQHKSRLLKTQLVAPAVNVAPNVTFSVTDCLLASFKKHTQLLGQHLVLQRGLQLAHGGSAHYTLHIEKCTLYTMCTNMYCTPFVQYVNT